MAKMKGYVDETIYGALRERYSECIRMLNGLEKSLERQIPEDDRRWIAREAQPIPYLNTET
jgi:hypothetical protein